MSAIAITSASHGEPPGWMTAAPVIEFTLADIARSGICARAFEEARI